MEQVRLDRYEIIDEIGKGAMGSVYLAQDPLIGRLVAIKTFNVKGLADTGTLTHLRALSVREASAAGILSHPNIVTIHDVVDTAGDSPPFIAMEYVRGTNLQELLKPCKPLPVDFVSSVLSQVSSALDYAHSKGVVHRDVKPANILITDDEQVKLTDFGIAYLRGADSANEKKRLGTPAYASPEQIMGDKVDHRADLFSLGVVLYEMLLGSAPFKGKTPAEVTHQIVHDPVPPPQSVDANFPASVADVLTKTLSKNPDHRFQSAGAMARAFRQASASLDRSAALPVKPDKKKRKRKRQVVETQVLGEPSKRRLGPAIRTALTNTAKGLGWTASKLVVFAKHLRSQDFSLRRVLLTSLVASAVLVTIMAAGLWMVRNSVENLPPITQEQALRLRYVPLLKEGRALLRAGEPEAAAELFADAELIAPSVAEIPRLRMLAEQEVARLGEFEEVELEMQTLLEEGRAALEENRLGVAGEIATQVQELDPERPKIQEFVLAVETATAEAEARRKAQPAPGPARATPPTPQPMVPAEQTPTNPEPEPTPAAPVLTGPADLRIDFFSHAPRGVLTIYDEQNQLLRLPFRFVEKSGFLRRKGISGRLESSLQIEPGRTTLRIYVSVGGEEPKPVTLPTTMRPGATYVLRIEVSKDGETKAYLN
ncbi:MAG: protein kinase [Thermoanaerobaculia bacterium]